MDSALKGCWFESWSPLGEPVAIKDHPPARSIAFLRLKTELSSFFFNKRSLEYNHLKAIKKGVFKGLQRLQTLSV